MEPSRAPSRDRTPPHRTPLFRLRPAREADREFCYRLNRIAMQPYVEATWGVWKDEQQRGFFTEKWWSPGRLSCVRVVEVECRGVGVLIAFPRGHELYLAEIQVLPEYQGLGIGSELIRQIIREAHPDPVGLQVLKTNPGARRLYERLGFVVTGQSGTHYFMRRHPDPPE